MAVTLILPIPRELTVAKLTFGPMLASNLQTSQMADAEFTQVFTGGRWRGNIQMPTEQFATAERLKTALTRVHGLGNRFWLYDWSRPAPKGSMAVTELLSTATFDKTVGLWAGGAGAVLTRNASRLKITNGAATNGYADLSFATVIGQSYHIDTFLWAGNNATYDVAAGSAVGLADVASTTGSGLPARILLKFTATSNPTWVRIGSNSAVAGQFMFADYCSASRIGLVNGAGQTGNVLMVDGLDANVNGALVEGDWFQWNRDMYRLVSDVDTDGGGQGWFEFEPALRASPADNDAISFYKAAAAFRLGANPAMWDIETGGITGYTTDVFEDVRN